MLPENNQHPNPSVSEAEFLRLAKEKTEQARRQREATAPKVTTIAAAAAAALTPEAIAAREAEEEAGRQRRKHWDEVRRKRQEEEAEQNRQQTILRMHNAANLPPRYDSASIDEADLEDVTPKHKKVAAHLRGLLTTPGIIALIGTRGSGKTTMACGCMNLFIQSRRFSLYARAMDVYLAVRGTFKPGATKSEDDIIAQYTKPQLLVVDELQVAAGSKFEQDVLTHIIDHRYAHLTSTILISNLTADGFVATVGDSITSRLSEMGGILTCDWPSFREKGRKSA